MQFSYLINASQIHLMFVGLIELEWIDAGSLHLSTEDFRGPLNADVMDKTVIVMFQRKESFEKVLMHDSMAGMNNLISLIRINTTLRLEKSCIRQRRTTGLSYLRAGLLLYEYDYGNKFCHFGFVRACLSLPYLIEHATGRTTLCIRGRYLIRLIHRRFAPH